MIRVITVLILTLSCQYLSAQDRIERIRTELESAIVDHPGLDGKVELSVNGTSLAEFIRAIGMAHSLNLTIEPNIDVDVSNNFADAKVSDVILYVCKEYDLEVEIIGSIISLRRYISPIEPDTISPTRPIGVGTGTVPGTINLDLRNDTLSAAIRAMNLITDENIVVSPGIKDKPVSIFIRNVTIEEALEKIAFSNDFRYEHDEVHGHRILQIEQIPHSSNTERGVRSRPNSSVATRNGDFNVKVLPNGTINVNAQGTPVGQLIEEVSIQSKQNYFILDPSEQIVSLFVEDATYSQFLDHVLRGTELTHMRSNGIEIIGKRDKEGLRTTEVFRMQNRPVSTVIENIPDGIKEGVQVTEFVELNGVILSGQAEGIHEIKQFLRALDQVVPVVTIEVMIVDVNKSRTMSAGLTAGIGGGPTQSGGTLLPSVTYDMNANSVNGLINSFNGFGLFNLGNVTSDFYLSLQALETDGYLKMRSTPQLSTINGHEATLSIGETEYYLEVQNNVIGTQNPTITTSQIYKPVNADLSLKILPIVSSEEVVTLEIEVNQSNFTERIADTAPPGTVERKFNSIIRVRDREMVVLGGLDEKEQSRSGSGIPFLSRIPVIRWFFGTRSSRTSKSKLTIFIRPTIIY